MPGARLFFLSACSRATCGAGRCRGCIAERAPVHEPCSKLGKQAALELTLGAPHVLIVF